MIFAVDKIIWGDFEAKSKVDLKADGPFGYAAAATTSAIVLAYAIGDAPARTWHADGAILDWDHAPDDLRAAFAGGALFAFWNAGFDTPVWNFATLGFPFLPPERVIDPMIQAGVSNLPTDLESASRALGGGGKQADGKKLIKLFCVEGAAPGEHPAEWQRFLSYARQDVVEMRDVYRRTRPLPREEWQQYWAFEHINRRGVLVDVPFVRNAAVLAAEDAHHIGDRLAELTDGMAIRITQAKRIAAWMHDQLSDVAMREVLADGTEMPAIAPAASAATSYQPLPPALTTIPVAPPERQNFVRLDQFVSFVDERHAIYRKRQAGLPWPWTDNEILRRWVFDNMYRHLDKTSAWIEENWILPHADDPHLGFAMLIARHVNRISTLGALSYPVPWVPEYFIDVMQSLPEGERYGGAYVIPAFKDDRRPKYVSQVEKVFTPIWNAWEQLRPRPGMLVAEFARGLRAYEGLGKGFLVGQVAADTKRVEPLASAADAQSFALSGPGSRIGMNYLLGRKRDALWQTDDRDWYPWLTKLHAIIVPIYQERGLPIPDFQDLQNQLCEWHKNWDIFSGFKERLKREYKPASVSLPRSKKPKPVRPPEVETSVPQDDDGDQAESELSLTRDRVAHVLAMLEAKHANGGLSAAETKAHEVATLRLYGAGAAPKKFARLAAQQVDGVLRGQYRFAGAGQTGRLTSRGAQIQNLTHDVLGEDGAAEAPLVDAIADGCSYAALVAAPPAEVPAARKLALLVRPALIAGPGKVLVGSDWSAIEARITPWLAASEGGEKVLDIFRAHDRDPTQPDIYTLAAADVLHKDLKAITKAERAIGKVTTLALGFGGSVGALQRMALSYRIRLEDTEARRIVTVWREANPWAREFWGAHDNGESFGLWGAALSAWEMPGWITTAGRLGFVYHADYLGGTLFLALPSGRLLSYPRPRWRDVDGLDQNGKPTGEKRSELSFRRARGRAKLWHGTFCENAVQATAADILRETVKRIEGNPALAFMPIRMTTHDEIVVEVDEARAAEAKALLRAEMLTLPHWAAGLPLQSEESVCPYYTKAKAALA